MDIPDATTDRAAGADRSQSEDLVSANHILYAQGVLDAFGHVSVRDRTDPGRFLLARNMAPASVQAGDIQSFDLDGTTTDPRPAYLERFIHSEIYRARPDVAAVVHSHSPAVVPFSVVDQPLRAVTHMGAFLGVSTPVFEIRDATDAPSDLLVRNAVLGRALAATLGRKPVALLRGHGSVAVGSSLPEAVFRAVYTEVNAAVQAQAAHLGAPTYLTAAEAEAAARSTGGQIHRAWALWSWQVTPGPHPPAGGTPGQ